MDRRACLKPRALKSLAALRPVDVHVHVFKTDPAFQSMMEKLNLKLVNILVMDDTPSPQIEDAWKLVRSSKGHVALCTTFDPYKFNDPAFPKDAIQQVKRDFKDGAVAVKIWKNIGMEIKDANGKYIMPDEPKFAPVYDTIQKHGKTLMSHVAEPNVAWGPPDPSDPSWPYYFVALLQGEPAVVGGGQAALSREELDSGSAITFSSRIQNSAWWVFTWEAWRRI